MKILMEILKRDKYTLDVEKGSEKRGKGLSRLLNFMDGSFKSQFYRLGVSVGTHPLYYIVGPTLLCILLTAGLFNFSYENDPIYLFAPYEGRAMTEQTKIESYFLLNYTSRFNPSRVTRPGRLVRVYVTTKDDETLLRDEVWKEIKLLDHLIRNSSIIHEGQQYNYDTLCAKWEGQCYLNDVVEVGDIMDKIERGDINLDYPAMFNPATLNTYYFPLFFGGMELSEDKSTIKSVKGVFLVYFANANTPLDDVKGYKWEASVLETIDGLRGSWNYLEVDRIAWRSVGEEVDQNLWLAFPLFGITIPLMIIFASVTMMSKKWVRAKPWLGIAAVVTTLMGVFAGFGVVAFLGVPLISINVAGLFLMIGIGIDDSFVMLAAWRRTSIRKTVAQRLGEAYSEAAVSITITSLTDMFSFWVGVFAPFHSVRIFCLYTGMAVVGTYLFHITVFGAAMAINGYLEADNRHGLFIWMQLPTTEKSPSEKPTEKSEKSLYTPEILEIPDYGLMAFFRDTWAYYLNKSWVKVCVILSFIIYLIIAGWGISQTEEGLDLGRLTIGGSYAQRYFQTEDNYFRSFPYRIQVVVSGDLDYSNKTVQRNIERMMEKFEQTEFIGKEGAHLSESWLRSFLRFNSRLESADLGLNLTSEREFVASLQENYLTRSSVFSEDVRFNEDNTKIIASRFIIQSVNITGANVEAQMAKTLRAIADEQIENGMEVTLFNPFFLFFDQYIMIRSTTIKSVVITGVIMMVLSLIFIPNPLCSLWVGLSIISIEAGVLGFLVLWSVKLDVISSICLIMCIGFSVDFSVHISYAYISSKAETPEERVKECLHSVGMPIAQGALSTILGITTAATAPSYLLTTFFKSITLVMFIAAAHGLLLLPVLLSIFGPGSCTPSSKKKEGKKKKQMVEGCREKYTKKSTT